MTTNDELQAALRALGDKLPPYEYAPEFVRVIKAAEALAAARQRRIERLEAALEPFAETYRGFLPALTGNEYDDPFWEWLMDHADGALIGDHYQRAHEALRDESGAE